MLGATVDISQLKRTEAALRTSETQFRTLANAIPQLAWMARPDGYVFWYNQRWYDYTGEAQGGGAGRPIHPFLPSEDETGLETRTTVLGHVQRGGSPTAYDRILATRFGSVALQAASRGEFGVMASLRQNEVITVPLSEAIGKQRLVAPDSQLVFAARAVGTCLGD